MGSMITQIPQLLSSVNAIQPVSNTTPNTIGTSSGPLTGSGVAYPSNTINILGGALAPTPTTNSIDPMDQMYLDLYGFNPYQLYGYPSFIDYNEAKQKNQGNAELEDYLGMLQSAQRLGVNVPNKVGFQELSNLITKAQTTNTAPPPITAGPSMTPYQQQAMSEILSKFGVSSLNDLRNNFKMNISGSGLPGSSSARIGPSVNTYTYTNPEAAIAARAKQLADEVARVKVNMAGYRPGARNGGRMGYADAGIVSLTDEDSGVIYRDEKGNPITKEEAMKLFNQQAEEESNSRPLDREDILQLYSDVQTTSKLLDKVLKDKKFKDPNDYRRLERIRNEYVDRKYDLDPTNYPDKKELMDAEKYFDKFNVDTRGVDIQLNDVMMDQGSKEFGKLYNYGKVKYNSPEGIQIVADKLGIPFEKAKDIKDVFEKSKTKFEYNLEDLDIKKITPKVVIMNKNGETQIMDEDLAKKLNANIIMNSFDTEQILRQENKANGGIIGLMGGGMPSMEMDYRGGGFIPIGAEERADDVPARLSKNEFVMTADAVRAAGGGSVNEGARRMYQLMNALEGRIV